MYPFPLSLSLPKTVYGRFVTKSELHNFGMKFFQSDSSWTNLYHTLGKLNKWKSDDMFLIFLRKRGLTFHANCLLFSWNSKPWNFYLACRVIKAKKKKESKNHSITGTWWACTSLHKTAWMLTCLNIGEIKRAEPHINCVSTLYVATSLGKL